jgi:hypothetical protein
LSVVVRGPRGRVFLLLEVLRDALVVRATYNGASGTITMCIRNVINKHASKIHIVKCTRTCTCRIVSMSDTLTDNNIMAMVWFFPWDL